MNIVELATCPIQRLYTDFAGPIKTATLDQSKHFVTLLDEHTGYSVVKFVLFINQTAKAVKLMIKGSE